MKYSPFSGRTALICIHNTQTRIHLLEVAAVIIYEIIVSGYQAVTIAVKTQHH